MPFANHGSLVAGFLEQFWKSLLVPVEPVAVPPEPVQMAVLSGQDDRSTWTANGIGAETVLKQHPIACQLVDLWCWIERAETGVVSPDGVRRVIIRKDENDIGSLVRCRLRGGIAG